jgi:excisionase family DNA binding protein
MMNPKALSGKDDNTLTIKATASRWHCHPLTVRRMIKSGRLAVHRHSRQFVRIPLSEVLRVEAEALVKLPQA